MIVLMNIFHSFLNYLITGSLSDASITEAYSEHCQTSRMERFMKIVNGQKPLTIFAKCSILNVWQGSEYASALTRVESREI